MAMRAHWMATHPDLRQEDIMKIEMVNAHKGILHIHAHRPSGGLHFSEVEAVDDSMLACQSILLLERAVHLAEYFQDAYGAETDWDQKTEAGLLGEHVGQLPKAIAL